MKKAFILAILLSLPVAVFLFLKFYGENTYEVPVYHVSEHQECGDSGVLQNVHMVVSGNGLVHLTSHASNAFRVIALVDEHIQPVTDQHVMQLARVYDVFFESGDVQLLSIAAPSISHSYLDEYLQAMDRHVADKSYWNLGYVKEDNDYMALLACALGLQGRDDKTDLVLMDGDGKIRGYYNSLDEEETERLILELRILKKQ